MWSYMDASATEQGAAEDGEHQRMSGLVQHHGQYGCHNVASQFTI